MKVLQAAVLVVIGALAAILYMKTSGPKAESAAAPVAQTAPVSPPETASPSAPALSPAPTLAAPAPASRPAARMAPLLKPAAADPARPAESAPALSPTPAAPAAVPSAQNNPPPEPVNVNPPPPVPPPPPPPLRQVTLQSGTLLPVRIIETLSSDRNEAGDTFTATLDRELVADGLVIAEKGARIEGRIVEADKAGRVKGLSQLAVELTRLHTSDGQKIEIRTESFAKQGEKSTKSDAAKIGAGAAIGAAIGAIAGGGKGAAIGAGVGGAAGTGTVVGTRGKAATIPSETRLSFRLREPVTITERRH